MFTYLISPVFFPFYFNLKFLSDFVHKLNSSKKIWSVDVNKNYVFINDIITENDKIRQMFENVLLYLCVTSRYT